MTEQEIADLHESRIATYAALPRLLEERSQLMNRLRAMLEAHCKDPDETQRGCHCFHAVEHAMARDAIAFAEAPAPKALIPSPPAPAR